MNKIAVWVCMLVSGVVLTGCFHKKPKTPVDELKQPVVDTGDVNLKDAAVEENDDDDDANMQEVDGGADEKADEKKLDTNDDTTVGQEDIQDQDELNEQGEFDQKKFEDEDIDEIVDLLEGLLEE